MTRKKKQKADIADLSASPNLIDHLASHPFVVIAVVGILICLPLIWTGLPASSDDTVWHVIYFDNFATQFLSGEVYPRWLYLANNGLGSPTFFYYQPMSYYIALIFRTLPISTAHQLGLASSLGVVMSGVTSYLWLREISGARAALVGSLFYLLLPYPVAQDVYIRAAFGKAFTFVWMPLAMLAVVRISRGSRLAVVGLAFSYGMLCMTHLPITVIFSPILVGYIAFFAEKGTLVRTLLMTLAGVALGAGMAAAYIIPAVAYQYYVNLNEMKEGSFFFGNWLMSRQLRLFGSMRYFQLTAEAVVTTLACAVVGSFGTDDRERGKLIFWSIVVVVSVVMTLSISYPIWSAITILQSLQFPWRFNSIASLAISALIAVALSTIDLRGSLKSKVLAAFLVIFGAFCVYDLAKVINDSQTRPLADWKKDLDKTLYRQQAETHGRWPIAVSLSVTDLDAAMQTMPSVDGRPAQVYFAAGKGRAEVERWRSRDIQVSVENTEPDTLVVAQFYFPGWSAHDVDSGTVFNVEPVGDLGLLSVKLPPGKHRIAFTLDKMRPEIVADALSLICVAIGLGLIVLLRRKAETMVDTSISDETAAAGD